MARFSIRLTGTFLPWIENFSEDNLNRLDRISRSVVAPMLENYAKQNAPWTDRTGAARRGLFARHNRSSETSFSIIFGHGVDYGIFLELANSGRYAIIVPTIEALFPRIVEELGKAWR